MGEVTVEHTHQTAYADDPTADVSSDEWNGPEAHTVVVDLDATDVGADPAGTAASAVATHAAASDPHPTYTTAAELASYAQPLDSDLTAIAALTTTSFGRSLLAAADAAALRTLAGAVIGTNVQAWDADLDAIAALTTTSFGRSVLAAADAAALRTLDASAPLASPTFTGTVTTAALTAGGQLRGAQIAPTALSADVNDWNPTSLAACNIIRVTQSGAGNWKITGIAAQPENTRIIVVNYDSAKTLTLAYQHASSSAANRFVAPNAVDLVMPPWAAREIVYVGGAWVIVGPVA